MQQVREEDDPTYLLLYIDDMLIVARKKTHVQKVKVQLAQEFVMKDLGEEFGTRQKDLRNEDHSRHKHWRFGYRKRTMFSRC